MAGSGEGNGKGSFALSIVGAPSGAFGNVSDFSLEKISEIMIGRSGVDDGRDAPATAGVKFGFSRAVRLLSG
jgi:hypothetical protein